MKKIALLSLIAYLLVLVTAFSPAFSTPTAFADDDDGTIEGTLNPTCSFSKGNYQASEDGTPDPAQDQLVKDAVAALESEIANANPGCGNINTATGSYEKGDCTEDGMVITEITEPIGSAVSISDAEGDLTNKVVTVYKGVCCFIPEFDPSSTTQIGCKEDRTIYADTYNNCTGSSSNPTAAHCEKRQWVVGTSGAGIIKVYVKQIYGWAAGIIGFVAVAVIVVSGIQITMSGVSGDITEAKNRILQSIAALALLFLSGIILYTINPTFFG